MKFIKTNTTLALSLLDFEMKDVLIVHEFQDYLNQSGNENLEMQISRRIEKYRTATVLILDCDCQIDEPIIGIDEFHTPKWLQQFFDYRLSKNEPLQVLNLKLGLPHKYQNISKEVIGITLKFRGERPEMLNELLKEIYEF